VQTRAHFRLDDDGELVKGVTYTGWDPFDTPVFLVRRRAEGAACVLALEGGQGALPIHDLQVLPVIVDGRPVAMAQGLAVSVTQATGTYLLIDCDLPGTKKAAGIATKESVWVGRMK
jgi:hypothetical protein